MIVSGVTAEVGKQERRSEVPNIIRREKPWETFIPLKGRLFADVIMAPASRSIRYSGPRGATRDGVQSPGGRARREAVKLYACLEMASPGSWRRRESVAFITVPAGR